MKCSGLAVAVSLQAYNMLAKVTAPSPGTEISSTGHILTHLAKLSLSCNSRLWKVSSVAY